MVRIFITLFFCAVLPSTYAYANADFDYLMGDVQIFEEDLQENLSAESIAKEEHMYQASDNLFPDDGERGGGGLGGTVFGQFVSVSVNGVPVDLTDVPGDVWFAPYVRDVADRGIVSGYRGSDGNPLGLFGPDDSVTIEQLAKMVIEATGNLIQDCALNDLRNKSAEDSWSEQYIQCAEYLRWAVFSDGSVDVQRPATRSEVVVTVLQAFEIPFARATGEAFKDVTASTEFSGAIERAAMDNIVSGYANSQGVPTGKFGPLDPVNRAAMAKILSLVLQAYAIN